MWIVVEQLENGRVYCAPITVRNVDLDAVKRWHRSLNMAVRAVIRRKPAKDWRRTNEDWAGQRYGVFE